MYLKAKVKTDDYKDLIIKYQDTGDLRLRDKIVEEHINLVYWVCKRILLPDNSFVDINDLFSYGIFGLLNAIDKFDVNKKVKFKTYAALRIRGAVYDNLRELDPVSRQRRIQEKKIQDVSDSYFEQNKKQISFRELSSILKIKLPKLIDILHELDRSNSVCSLQAKSKQVNENHAGELLDTIEADKSLCPDVIVESNYITKMIHDIISNFSERKRKCIVLYFFEELTLNEIGQVLGTTEANVCQIIKGTKKEMIKQLKNMGITKDILKD